MTDEAIVVWVPDEFSGGPRISGLRGSGLRGSGLRGVRAHGWSGGPELAPEADEVQYVVLPIGPPPSVWDSLKQLPRLKTVQLVTAGYEAAIGRLAEGVALSNGRGIHDPAVAEWTVAVTLSTLRSLPELHVKQQEQTWVPWRSGSLFGATVLIVGYGSIGHAVEELMAPFHPEFLRVSRTGRDGSAPVSELPELIGRADVVVVLLPETPETRGLFDAQLLARMKTGALLINAGRGSAVVTDALIAELNTGRLRAALDVAEGEPLQPGDPLWAAPGLILTPHVASNAEGKEGRIEDFIVAQLLRLGSGEPLINVVSL